MLRRLLLAPALAAALAVPALAQPAGDPTQPSQPHQRLAVGQSQLQQLAMRLRRAKDTGGEDRRREVVEVQQSAQRVLEAADATLDELQQNQKTDDALQAIRNAKLEVQSAREDLRSIEADTPGAAIQALEDLARALTEVRDNVELAGQPPG